MNFSPRKNTRDASFDLTPMIDVVLQLIIFFMYTTQFSQVVRTQLDLPEEPGEETLEQQPGRIVIDITADGGLIVEREPVTREQLLTRVRSEITRLGDPAEVRLLLRADRSAPTGAINSVAAELAAMGVRGWTLGTERPR